VRIAFAPAVARGRHFHQTGVELVLQITRENAVLDQHRAMGRRAFVVDVDRAAARRHGAVVDHRAELRRDPLADAIAESRGLFAIEISLEAVTDRFVEQNAGPARP